MPFRFTVSALTLVLAAPALAPAQSTSVPERANDRGPGVATSMFGTFITRGELLVYPFYEFYKDDNYEYKPEELGAAGDVDYRGRYRAKEGLVFIGYGVTENLAVEMEVAGIAATFEKSPLDRSLLPSRVSESGLGDVEGQVRWRWKRETARRPEVFTYAELVVPHNKDKVLIGTSGVEIKAGTGIARGFAWGTVMARAAVEYARSSSSPFDLGEYAVEYTRRLGPRWRVYAGLEGTGDELSAIGELQWHVSRRVIVKANSGVGLTSKATDYSPELGILFSVPVK